MVLPGQYGAYLPCAFFRPVSTLDGKSKLSGLSVLTSMQILGIQCIDNLRVSNIQVVSTSD